jgi:orotate phosphoribosyltransferase
MTAMTTTQVAYDERLLIEMVRAKAVEFGTFRLASGQISNFYLDCRKLTLDSAATNLIAAGMWEKFQSEIPSAVGGMAVGAVPIVASVLCLAGSLGVPLLGFFVRKEAKDHGTGKLIEGPVSPGQTAVIVEDVVTTGGSCIAAIEAARAFGLEVTRALAIIDRKPGNHPEFERIGVRLDSLLTIDQLGLKS